MLSTAGVKLGKKVFAEGPKHTSLMLVGESPGRDEEREGRPFVGITGKWLEEQLKKIGVERKQLYLTNACKYRPKPPFTGKRKPEWFIQGGEPTPWFLEGIAELKADIERIRPNVVVPMGNFALWALTEQMSVMKWRGSILESTLVPGQKLVPSIHPSFFIRGNMAQHPLLVWDLRRAVEESADPGIKLPSRKFTIFPTSGEIARAVERLISSPTITIDTEWYTPDDLACIGFTNSPSWAICIPVDAPGAFDAYRAILGSDAIKVFQNAMFDCTYLERVGLPVKGSDAKGRRLIEDIMVGHYVNWQAIKKGLDTTTSIYTREPYYKDDYKVATKGAALDKELYYTYNCKDVVVTHEIWDALQGEFEEWDTRRAYELNMMTFNIMKDATITGIKADFGKLQEAMEFYEGRVERMQELLNDVCGEEVNTRSPKQVAELVYDRLNIRRTGRKADQQTLMDIAAQTDDQTTEVVLKMIISIRRDRNTLSRYINERVIDEDGRIRSSWNMAGTENGRLSASKDGFKNRGVSLQTTPVKTPAMPYSTRDFCIADDGHVLLKPDLSQAEARVVAFEAKDYLTIDWMEEGLDIHAKLAERLFDVPYESIEKESRERYLSKKCRHALNYIMGARTFKLTINREFIDTGFGVTEAEAKHLRDQYLTIHAPLKMWWKRVERDIQRQGMQLKNPLGRVRTFTEAWGNSLIKEAVAFVPQSTIADITHIGLKRVADELPYAQILVNMHDGSIIQVPEEKRDEACAAILELLTIPIIVQGEELTVPVEVEYGHSWGDMRKWYGKPSVGNG